MTDFKVLTRLGIDAITFGTKTRQDSTQCLVDIIPTKLSYLSLSFFNIDVNAIDGILLQIIVLVDLKAEYAPHLQTIKLVFQHHRFLPANISTLQKLQENCKGNRVKIIEKWYSWERIPFPAFIKEFE